jgi:hypothetical protein
MKICPLVVSRSALTLPISSAISRRLSVRSCPSQRAIEPSVNSKARALQQSAVQKIWQWISKCRRAGDVVMVCEVILIFAA